MLFLFINTSVKKQHKVMKKIRIREIEKTEYPLIEDFLYSAIYIPEGEEWPPREIIFEPEIYIYVKDFGLDSDCGVVAEHDPESNSG